MAKGILKNSGVWFVVILLGVLFALWWGLGFAEQVRQDRVVDTEIERILDERGEGGLVTDAIEGLAAGGTRAETILVIEENAARLLPDVTNASTIARFWFSADDEIYVEYGSLEPDQIDRMAFLSLDDEGGLARTALYGQANSGTWELIDGDEVLFTKPLRNLYERDAEDNWVARN